MALNLGRMLLVDEGAQVMQEQLAREFSQETLSFWQAAIKFREAVPSTERTSAAREIVDRFVSAGSEEQVNLPCVIMKDIERSLAHAEASATPVSPKLLLAAEQEVFELMDRNAHHRFRTDPTAVQSICDALFATCHSTANGEVTLEAYKEWVARNPTVIVYFQQIAASVRALLRRSHSRRGFPASPRFTEASPRPSDEMSFGRPSSYDSFRRTSLTDSPAVSETSAHRNTVASSVAAVAWDYPRHARTPPHVRPSSCESCAASSPSERSAALAASAIGSAFKRRTDKPAWPPAPAGRLSSGAWAGPGAGAGACTCACACTSALDTRTCVGRKKDLKRECSSVPATEVV